MRYPIWKFTRWPLLGMLILLLLLGVQTVTTQSAAEVIQQEEAPGQFLYESRLTLQDQTGNDWRAIAFKRVYPDGNSILYLRFEGIPGLAYLSLEQPLTLITSQEQTLEAPNMSSEIFPNASPVPHLRQYDLQPVLSELDSSNPIRLALPTDEGLAIEFTVSPTVIQEWKTVDSCEDFVCDPAE